MYRKLDDEPEGVDSMVETAGETPDTECPCACSAEDGDADAPAPQVNTAIVHLKVDVDYNG